MTIGNMNDMAEGIRNLRRGMEMEPWPEFTAKLDAADDDLHTVRIEFEDNREFPDWSQIELELNNAISALTAIRDHARNQT